MPPHAPVTAIVEPSETLVMIVGSYGSGKTEVTVNLAIQLAEAGRKVQVADLDIVNPYFRCREARELMETHDIRVVVPPGSLAHADLPIILPQIRGMLQPPAGTLTLFDVGGDDVGARALSAFRPVIEEGAYELWQVVNARRPFTQDVAGCLAMQRSLEESSRLAVTGLIVNTHLIEDTTPEVVLEGWHLAKALAAESGLPIRCVSMMAEHADAPELADIDAPRLRLRRHMLPPFATPAQQEPPSASGEKLPAARPVPIGKPGPLPLPKSRGESHG